MRNILLLMVVSLLTACSSVQVNELTHDESLTLSGKSLVYTRYYDLPDFSATTATNVVLGKLGKSIAVSNGNAMIVNNYIDDPAVGIAMELADGLDESYGLRVVTEGALTRSSEINHLVGLYEGYDYILDVRTTGWGSLYYQFDWDNYSVNYSVFVRLINRADGAVLAQEHCFASPVYEDLDLAPSYDELESGGRLQEELNKNATACVDYIRKAIKLYAADAPVEGDVGEAI